MAHTPDDPTKAQVWITKGIDDLDFEFYFPQGPKGDPGGITLGTDLGTANLNEIVTSGTYRQSTGANASLLNNYPSASTIGTLEVQQRHGTAGIQVYTPAGQIATRFYVRGWEGSTWHPWKVYSSQRVDQTAGRAIYTWDELNGRDQLIYGDTGNRILTMDNGYGGTLIIRRIGSIISLYGTITRPPGGSLNGIFLTTIPVGFQPTSAAWTYFPVRHSGSSAMFSIYRKGNELNITDSMTDSDTNQLRFEISWQTTQAWPTTLPGTASGTIPNL